MDGWMDGWNDGWEGYVLLHCKIASICLYLLPPTTSSSSLRFRPLILDLGAFGTSQSCMAASSGFISSLYSSCSMVVDPLSSLSVSICYHYLLYIVGNQSNTNFGTCKGQVFSKQVAGEGTAGYSSKLLQAMTRGLQHSCLISSLLPDGLMKQRITSVPTNPVSGWNGRTRSLMRPSGLQP